MDMNSIYIWGTIGALFCFVVGALYGHCRRENYYGQFVADSREAFNNERNARISRHRADLAACDIAIQQERNVVREMEISLLQAGMVIEAEALRATKSEDARKDSADYRKALIQALIDHDLWNINVLGDTPAFMLTRLMTHVAECALDPTQNQKAKNLYVKGVRAGAKKGRAQMQKLMQKSIDNQAETITRLSDGYDAQVLARQDLTEGLSASRMRHGRFVIAVRNILDDKIALPSVRRSLKKAISLEVTRLREVETNKGK